MLAIAASASCVCPNLQIDGPTGYCCGGRPLRTGPKHTNRILDYCPLSPGSCPLSKHVASFDAIRKPETKHSSASVIGRQQKREQKYAVQVFCEHPAEFSASCVRLCFLSRDRTSSWHWSALSSLLSIAPQREPSCQPQAPLVPKQFGAHVGPELFCHIEECIQSDLLSPLIRGISKRSVRGGIVNVGDACSHSISGQL